MVHSSVSITDPSYDLHVQKLTRHLQIHIVVGIIEIQGLDFYQATHHFPNLVGHIGRRTFPELARPIIGGAVLQEAY